MAPTSATASRSPRSDDERASKEESDRIRFRREPACASAGTEAGHCDSLVAASSGRSRLIHGKANSDRIMGRPAGNGEVPTPKRTMSPDNGTVGTTAVKGQRTSDPAQTQGASPLHPRQGSRTLVNP